MTWNEFRAKGFYFRQAATVLFAMGAYAHVTRAFIGDELLLQHVLTPEFDRVLAIPMVYAAITGIAGWWLVEFRGILQRVVYAAIVLYIAGSLPLHIRSYFDDSAVEQMVKFPMWWTYVLFVLFPAIIIFCWRLRYRQTATQKVTADVAA